MEARSGTSTIGDIHHHLLNYNLPGTATHTLMITAYKATHR